MLSVGRPIEIRTPIWNGGKRCVGIAEWRLRGKEFVLVRITYRNKNGELIYPGVYEISTMKLWSCPRQMMKNGVAVRVVPIEDMREVSL